VDRRLLQCGFARELLSHVLRGGIEWRRGSTLHSDMSDSHTTKMICVVVRMRDPERGNGAGVLWWCTRC